MMRPGREILVDSGAFDYDVSDLLDEPGDSDESWLLDVLDAMPDPKRSVVEMIAIGRLGKTETARRLGLSRQWVTRLWTQGKDKVTSYQLACTEAVAGEGGVTRDGNMCLFRDYETVRRMANALVPFVRSGSKGNALDAADPFYVIKTYFRE